VIRSHCAEIDVSILERRYKPLAYLSGSMSTSLADQECEACTSEDEPLTEPEYADYLAELDDEVWEVVDEHHLEGTYAFEDFRDALEFTYEVGELAEDEWHHPDIHLSWGEVQIEMWTHKIDGLHKTDFVMAARMDRIHGDYA
jgi:4a-hydroxytetrahydrobiopterin dehydratase